MNVAHNDCYVSSQQTGKDADLKSFPSQQLTISNNDPRLPFEFDRALMKTLKTNEYKVFRNLQDRAGTNRPPSKSKGFCWPSLQRIAEDCNCSVSTVQRALKKLEALKLLRCEDRVGETTRYYPARANRSLITQLEGPAKEKPVTLPEITSNPGQTDLPTPVNLTTHPGQFDQQTYKENYPKKNYPKEHQHQVKVKPNLPVKVNNGAGGVADFPMIKFLSEEVGISKNQSHKLSKKTKELGHNIDWLKEHWDYCQSAQNITNPAGLLIKLILDDETPRKVSNRKQDQHQVGNGPRKWSASTLRAAQSQNAVYNEKRFEDKTYEEILAEQSAHRLR